MFVVEAWAGIAARSAALIADSVDMFGDASVYVLSLYALDRSLRWRAGAALVKGAIILAFGLGLLVEVGRRLLVGGVPTAETIGVVGLLALTANLICLALLWRFRTQDVNMSSTFECSRRHGERGRAARRRRSLVDRCGMARPARWCPRRRGVPPLSLVDRAGGVAAVQRHRASTVPR